MNQEEKEVDAEMKRLKEKKRIDEKKEKLQKLKDELEPGLLTQIYNIFKKGYDKL